MILDSSTHPDLFHQGYIKNDASISLLPHLNDTFIHKFSKGEIYILPQLLYFHLDNKQFKAQYCEEILSSLKEQGMDDVIDAIIRKVLTYQTKVQAIEALLPYIKLNETFNFNLKGEHHNCIGLTPLMLVKQRKTIDLFISQKELDLSIKANPMCYYDEYKSYFQQYPFNYEAQLKESHFKKIDSKNTFELSVLMKDKYKTAKLFENQTPEQKTKIEQVQFEAIVNSSKMSEKMTLMMQQMSAQNQYLLEHLDDKSMADLLSFTNNKQGNMLFHAIKEGHFDFVKKMITLSYFKKEDRNPYQNSYIMYCYHYNKYEIAELIFKEGFYDESDDILLEKVRKIGDANLYQLLFFKNPQKEHLAYSIKLGTPKIMQYLFDNNMVSLDEIVETFYATSRVLLLNNTTLTVPDLTYIYATRQSRESYFYLLRHLIHIDTSKNYLDEFLNHFSSTFSIAEKTYRERARLDREVVRVFSALVKYIPQAKKDALPTFLSFNNPYFMKLEKQSLEAFLEQFENEELKVELKIQKRTKI